MKNLMVAFTLFVLGRIYPFWANFVEKIRIVSLSWNLVPLVPILIRIFKIQWWCSFYLFYNTLFGHIWSKNPNCQFKVKFCTKSNSNMQNLMEIPFFGKFGSKSQNCQFKLKFSTYTNTNLKNWTFMFVFSAFKWEYPFFGKLGLKNQF